MANNRKVAVVTGSNKGIGFEIVKQLCKRFDGDVYLTSRNADNGKKALEELAQQGLHPKFYQLDILNVDQIKKFAEFLKDNYGGVDVLVNNAAILYDRKDRHPVEKFVNELIRTNFTATVDISMAFLPILKSNARVVNVSSRLGLLGQIKNNEIKQKFRDPNLTLDGLIKLVDDYIEACKNGTDEKLGYPQSAMSSYNMSKIALNAFTRVYQNMVDADSSRKGIYVFSCCPGYCKTEMTRGGGFLSATQGAETPTYLSLLPPGFDGPKGSFWAEEKHFDWETGSMLTTGMPMLKKMVTSLFKR